MSARPNVPKPREIHRAGNRILRCTVRLSRWIPFGFRTNPPRTVLVYRLGNIGDIVVALPVFHALRRRFPESRMVLLTSPTRRGAPSASDVLQHDPTFQRIITYYADEAKKPGFLRTLRATLASEKPDLAVALPNFPHRLGNLLRHVMLLTSAGVRHIVGMQLVEEQDYACNQVERLMRLVQELNLGEIEPTPWIKTDASDEAAAEALLQPAAPNESLIAVQVGAKRAANRWPLRHFLEVAKEIQERDYGHLIFTGTAAEAAELSPLIQALPKRATVIAGKTSIPVLAAVLRRCRALITNDTGTMHVAAAMGCPVIAVFSGRDYDRIWYPYGAQHRVLRATVPCSPCLEESCPLYPEPECLLRISPSAVLEALVEVLHRSDGITRP